MEDDGHKDNKLKIMNVLTVIFSIIIVSLVVAVIILACKLKNRKKI